MGTNFYYIRKIEDSDKAELMERLNEIDKTLNGDDNSRELRRQLSSLLDYVEYDMKKTSIHIGKRSSGWQFLFNHNDFEFYGPTLESIKAFLNCEDGKIIDEYGDEYTADEFWNYIGKQIYYKKGTYIDCEEYYSNPDNLRYYYPSNPRTVEYGGVKFVSNFHEYKINGLRFSDSTDFA